MVSVGLSSIVTQQCKKAVIVFIVTSFVVYGIGLVFEGQFVLEEDHKRSCWKNSIGVSVTRPFRLDVYVCSESC
jgi:hypothetical protein